MRPLFSLLLLLATLGPNASACSCIGRARSCEYLNTDAVFIGKVRKTEAVQHTAENGYYRGYSMRFQVTEVWHGIDKEEVVVETGSGGGDCGTPLQEGHTFLIFAYRGKDGELWTGMCSGNIDLTAETELSSAVGALRALSKTGVGSVFGSVHATKPIWRDDEVTTNEPTKLSNITVRILSSGTMIAAGKTDQQGNFEIPGLPPGSFKVVPDISAAYEYSKEYPDRYEPTLRSGACEQVTFELQPKTKVKGRVFFPPGYHNGQSVEVTLLPVGSPVKGQFSGANDFTGERDEFEIWPLPPGDYYVGVNINTSPKEDEPFPPTFFPGVTDKDHAQVVHLREGEEREIEIRLPELAKTRTVSFVAVDFDGKPLRHVYIQREDLRYLGDAASNVNVDLDSDGRGSIIIYEGYSYHLHAQEGDQCSRPVKVSSGKGALVVKFVMNKKSSYCSIDEIDGRQ